MRRDLEDSTDSSMADANDRSSAKVWPRQGWHGRDKHMCI